MEMVVMAVPGADLFKPGSIALSRTAEFALDVCIYEHPIDRGNRRRQFQQPLVLFAPESAIEAGPGTVQEAGGGNVGAPSICFRIEAGIQVEPDISVEAGLMAAMAERHRSAPGQRKIADLNHADRFARALAQSLNRPDQRWMAEVAFALQVHDEEPVAIGGQRSRPADAAVVGRADGEWRSRDRAGYLRPRIGEKSARKAE